MSLDILVHFSNVYGKDPAFVLAGGGNTSYKNADALYIKGSGTSLATITADGFVKMDRHALSAIWDKTYPADTDAREAAVLADMMAAKCPGEEAKRPSVETLLHDLFPQTYILHVHPSAVNAITCSKEGKDAALAICPDAVWVEECNPGYILAANCREKMLAYREKTGRDADVVFLQNHGIFFAANTEEELNTLVSGIMDVVTYIGVGGALPGSGWILADGILTIILSFFVLGNQAFTAVSLPFIFGIWIIFSGITRLVNAMEFQRVGAQGWGWMIVHGILDILFGILCFLEPLAGSIAIGILVGVSFLLQAAFTFFMLWEMIRAKRI